MRSHTGVRDRHQSVLLARAPHGNELSAYLVSPAPCVKSRPAVPKTPPSLPPPLTRLTHFPPAHLSITALSRQSAGRGGGAAGASRDVSGPASREAGSCVTKEARDGGAVGRRCGCCRSKQGLEPLQVLRPRPAGGWSRAGRRPLASVRGAPGFPPCFSLGKHTPPAHHVGVRRGRRGCWAQIQPHWLSLLPAFARGCSDWPPRGASGGSLSPEASDWLDKIS